ncbi:NUDIX domain-containing protein [Chloroflexota bacterium]
MPNRDIRYQGAIVRDNHILLIRHRENESGRSYWVLPGGGIETGETEEACVIREMKEETNLYVRIVSLLLDELSFPEDNYRVRKTYHCEPILGEASPGFEPEPEVASWYSIVEVKWFNLQDETGWDPELISDPYSYPQVQRVRKKLGYML